ncbi:hypothetical protein [Streptacidiphilus sp. EB129]|jgi:hypothetical protein|uniref:hypothetical protein n=1 Tax=Streptacidiphilus sp. EB129 TaxID=3156262 RepID=UPI00351151CE
MPPPTGRRRSHVTATAAATATAAVATALLCGWTVPCEVRGTARPSTRPAAQAVPPSRTHASHHSTDGMVPIALGLLLTGIAVYKHRGLPRGH